MSDCASMIGRRVVAVVATGMVPVLPNTAQVTLQCAVAVIVYPTHRCLRSF